MHGSSPQMMGTATCLHRNHAGRKLGYVVDQRLPPHGSAHNNRTNSIDACNEIIAELKQMRDVWQEIDQSGVESASETASGSAQAQAAAPAADQSVVLSA